MKSVKAKCVTPVNPNSKVVKEAEAELLKLKVQSKSKRTRKGKVSSRVPPVEIQLDDAAFTPVTEDGQTFVYANVPFSINGNRQFAMVHRNASTVDCGFSAKVPEGYKLVLDLTPELKDHGLEVYKNVITGEGRVTLSVRNLGREIAVVNHRDRVAALRIEPIYSLTFKVVE